MKLLQKSYAGKIKMIYIDPPYNTGKDFIYKDRYKDNLKNYQEFTGQVDSGGNKLSTNSDSDGRFHSNWLNMIYPRLRLARNLLKDDGVICISIDDNEVANLSKLVNEIFGEDNYISLFIWKKKQGGGNNSNHVVVEHEYIIMISKNRKSLKLNLDKKYELDDKLYPFSDENGDYGLITLDKSSIGFSQSGVFEIRDKEGNIYLPRIIKGKQSRWRWSKQKVENEFTKLVFKSGKVYTKYYRPIGVIPKSLLIDPLYGRTETGNDDLRKVFDNEYPFSYPKPISLIKHFIAICCKDGDIVLDFFAGSSSTAHSVIACCLEDNIKLKFIQVQLPEKTDKDNEAYKSRYSTIAEIGKERIRRAVKKIKEEHPIISKELDLGFKVFKLDSSNIKSWDGNPDNVETSLLDTVENIKPGRTEEDVLYEILLKSGLDLTLPIEGRNIEGKKVFNIGLGSLFICLADNITRKVAEGIGQWKKECNPEICRVVFKDNGFSDIEKTNSVQTLKRYGIDEIKTI